MNDPKMRKWLHDLNNRVGMIMANAELMQLDNLTPKSLERTQVIVAKSLEVRDILREIVDHLSQDE